MFVNNSITCQSESGPKGISDKEGRMAEKKGITISSPLVVEVKDVDGSILIVTLASLRLAAAAVALTPKIQENHPETN